MNVLEILDPGLGAAFQDTGRRGWRRFGVPLSGAMDDHAAAWANRLLDNPPNAPVVELRLQGAVLRVLRDAWLAVTGANPEASVPVWRAVRVKAGEELRFPRVHCGVWTYLAVEGGFDAPRALGSASAYPRGGLGATLARGDLLRRETGGEFELPAHVAGRSAAPSEQRDYRRPPALRVWPGPQWNLFSEADRARFFENNWTVAPQSDRVGYRFQGDPIQPQAGQILSEPIRVGTVQVPEDGLPIAVMRDGPTVGGYPKLGVLAPADVSWLAQCLLGQAVRFAPAI